jgi:hypothetical protein
MKGSAFIFRVNRLKFVGQKEWADNGILADITFLELFPVVISVHIWGIHLKNKRIIFNVDNQAVVAIINKSLQNPTEL